VAIEELLGGEQDHISADLESIYTNLLLCDGLRRLSTGEFEESATIS
jgi:hypothetical protein